MSFYWTPAAVKHHRVACLCEVSPDSEQYIVSHSLSINLRPWEKKSLLHVFLLSFQSPHLPNPLKSSPEFLRLLKSRTLKCMVTSEMQMSTNQILSSICTCLSVVACFYVYLCLLWRYVNATFAQRGGLQVRFKCVVLGAFTLADGSNSNQVLGIFHNCQVYLNRKKNVF